MPNLNLVARKYPVTNLILKASSIADLWALQVEKYGDRTFLIVPTPEAYREVSFNELSRKVEDKVSALHFIGISKGDRVAFLSPNHPEFIEAALAVWTLGATVVSINPKMPMLILEHFIRNSDATSLVVFSETACLEAGRSLKRKFPDLKMIILNRIDENDIRENEFLLSKPIMEDTHVTSTTPDSKLEDIALILYTSGSSKMPKGVPLSHRNILFNREASQQAWKDDFTDSETTLGWLPFFHVMGLPFEFLGNLYVGARYAFPRLKPGPPTPVQLLSALRDTEATVFYTVPRMLAGLQKMAQKDSTVLETLRKLKFIMSGGVVLAHELGEFFQSNGINVIQGEGMTEAAGAIFLGDPKLRAWQTLRLIPGMNADFVKVPGLAGMELVLENCPSVSAEYLKNIEATRMAYKKPGRFYTGDIFERVDEGFVYLGRSDETFSLTGGEKINPLPIENALIDGGPEIDNVVILGENQSSNRAIIQPNYSHLEGADVIEAVWTIFKKVNVGLPNYAKISKTNMIILDADATIPVTPKGNVIRTKVNALLDRSKK